MSVEVDEILDKLPSFSPSVNKLLDALKKDFVEPKELEILLVSCPVIAGRVLQISNSSFYGFSRQIDSLKEACVILGQHTLRSLVYTLAVIGDYRDDEARQDTLSYDSLWKHSLFSACLARVVAQANKRDSSNLFTTALFQHLGLIVLDNFDNDWMPQALNVAATGSHTMQDAVSEVTGLNYLEVSYKALEYWNFPEEVCHSVEAIYDGSCGFDQQTLNIANGVADAFGYQIAPGAGAMALLPGTVDAVFTDQDLALEQLHETDVLFVQMAKDFLG